MVKKFSELYLWARKAIMAQEDMDTASFYARNLLCHLSDKSWEYILTNSERYASEDVCEKMEAAVQRILADEPLAYILGEWEFYGMRLVVTPDVLIPRDDTCAVTDLAIKKALYLPETPRILDLCTGSGCIGLAIANRVKDARVTLADISPKALAVAKKNTALQKLSGRVSCVQVNALEAAKPFLGKFDLIVSNPPYITEKEMRDLPKSVGLYEPQLALSGGIDGLDFYNAIAMNFASALKPGGFLCFEFGMGQGDAVCEILENNGYTILERSKDYNNIERAVLAQYSRKGEENGNEKDRF